MLNHALLKTLLFTKGLNGRWGLPGLVWGDPGIGKTVGVKEFAAMYNMEAIILTLSLREPSDVLGVPIPVQDPDDPDRMITVYARPEVAQRAQKATREGRGVIIFLDELTTAAPALQAAGLRVVNEGVIGDEELPPTVRFIAAANPTDIAAGGHDLSIPLANRFGHFFIDAPNPQDWCNWAMLDGGDNETSVIMEGTDLEAKVEKRWATEYAKARAHVASFIGRTGGITLHRMPKSSDPTASLAWPSPRTWELAMRSIAGAAIHGLDEVAKETLIASFVGEPAAAEYLHWLHAGDLPDPEKLLDGKEVFEHDQRRSDRTLVTLNACASILCSMKGKKKKEKELKDKRYENFWKVALNVSDGGEDLIFSAVRVLASGRGIKASTTESKLVMKKVSPMLREIGLLSQN